MQRLLLIVLLWLLIGASPLQAQKIYTGPKAGANISWVRFIDDKAKEKYTSLPIVGYNVGAAVHFPVTKAFSLHTEVNLANRGKNLRLKTEEIFFHKVHYRHIETVAMFRYSFGNENFLWYVNAGPNLSYWLSGKGKAQLEEMDELSFKKHPYHVRFGAYDDSENDLYMFLNEVNRFQINLNFGFGMMLKLINDHYVQFDLRYRKGQTNMGENKSGKLGILEVYRDNLKSISQSASFSVTYLALIDFEGMLKGKSTIKAKRRR